MNACKSAASSSRPSGVSHVVGIFGSASLAPLASVRTMISR